MTIKPNPEISIPISWLEQAMKYHGILGAKQVVNAKTGEREWMFNRGDKLCPLFTDACIIYITGGKCGNFKEFANSLSFLD